MGIEQFLLERAQKQGIEKGFEKGINEKTLAFTQRLIRETTFTADEIARLAGVSVTFVEDVKKSAS